jgi:quercetin dioxygenase-like cupin family protein
MDELKVVRLDETDVVKFGPDAVYQLILGDDEGTTPIRTGIQTSQPGYVAPVHSHPYMEVLHILDGVAEAWVDGREDSKVTLRKGDTIAIPPRFHTASASWATRCSGFSARTPRRSGSSTTRTARRATRAATAFTNPERRAGLRPARRRAGRRGPTGARRASRSAPGTTRRG